MKVIDLLRKLSKANKGIMVSIDIPDEILGKLPNIEWPEGSEIEEESHVSVVLFDNEEELDKERLISLVSSVCVKKESMTGKLNGVGRFLECHKEGFHCIYLNFDCPGLSELRNELVEVMEGEGYQVSKNHGFTPHMTLAYIPKEENPDVARVKPISMEVKGLSVYWNSDKPVFIPFGKLTKESSVRKLIKVLDSGSFLKWDEQEHPRASDGRFGTKAGQPKGKLTEKTTTMRTHAKHAENTQIRDMAKKHFRNAAAKVRGAIGEVDREGDAKLVEAMDHFQNIMRLGDPREAFNYFVNEVKEIKGVDAKEINRIALNQRNMYYKKLRGIKLQPKPVRVVTADKPVEKPKDVISLALERSPHKELIGKMAGNEIVIRKSLGGGEKDIAHANLAYRISIKDDGRACLKGVSYNGEYGMPQNEVFCSDAATMVGFDIVPPCVYREDEEMGSCSAQHWLENGILGEDVGMWSLEDTPELRKSISQLAVFDVVLGNRDRHLGNWMFDEDTGTIKAIDNGLVGLDAGRGAMDPGWVAKMAIDRMISVVRRVNNQKLTLKDVIDPHDVEVMREFVESSDFDDLMRQHFGQQQFQVHLEGRGLTVNRYVENMHKMAKYGLGQLDNIMNKVTVADRLRKAVGYGKIRVV